MKKNGFTLVELLAVIVILGIIMAIASSSLITTKKEANIREAEQIEKSIKDIGVEVYLDKGYGEYLISELGDYLKSKNIKNPAGGDDCDGKLYIRDSGDGPEFDSCLYCPGIEGFEESCD